jgi:hypothetical protein
MGCTARSQLLLALEYPVATLHIIRSIFAIACGLSLVAIVVIEVSRSGELFYWPGQKRHPPTRMQVVACYRFRSWWICSSIDTGPLLKSTCIAALD